jgi:hypothetical protein
VLPFFVTRRRLSGETAAIGALPFPLTPRADGTEVVVPFDVTVELVRRRVVADCAPPSVDPDLGEVPWWNVLGFASLRPPGL